MLRTLPIVIVIVLLSFQIREAKAAGFIFVRDLHKKCLINHQKCLRTCASEYSGKCSTSNAIVCATICMEDYKLCEIELDTMRCLMDEVPLVPEYSDNYKVEETRNVEEQLKAWRKLTKGE